MELLREIIYNLKIHKIRTILTSFGIAWGIFIIVVLLGISGGVQEGVNKLFRGFTEKTIWFYAGESRDYKTPGTAGKVISFKMSELTILKKRIPEIGIISPEIAVSNYPVHNNFEKGFFAVYASSPEFFELKNLNVKHGRILNQRDALSNKRIAIIGDRVASHFFNESDPIGEYIYMNGIGFRVIGLLENKTYFTLNQQGNIFIPYTSFIETIKQVNEINAFGIKVSSGEGTKKCEDKIRSFLARNHGFDKNNTKALYVVNYEEQMSTFSKFFSGFNIFLLFVGICLLLSGVVGISNVMYITVKERTQEIGIKKAIGATSSVILKEVIMESLLITLLSGFVGFITGVFLLKIIDVFLLNKHESEQFLSGTAIEPKYLVLAFIILLFSGIMAGIFPANKAANIKPVEAIQSNYHE